MVAMSTPETAIATRRVRPSSLHLAEHCSLAPYLSVVYPASHANTRFGSSVDAQVSAIVKAMSTGDYSEAPAEEDLFTETSKIIDWLEANYPIEHWEYHVQERVELLDPETGEVLTAGTPDLLCLHRTDPVLVDVDWKKRGQMWAGHLPPPDENLQQLAYVAAAWLHFSQARKIERAKIVLACWDAKGVTPLESGDITEDRLYEIVSRIRAVPMIDLSGPRPEASVGDHCDHCYQRMHCPEHLIPATALVRMDLAVDAFREAGAGDEPRADKLDADTAAQALGWIEIAKRRLSAAKKMVELVEANVDAYVIQNGPVEVGEMVYGPMVVVGRRSGATVATLEEEGLQRLIRVGEQKIKCKFWKK
jgi:hypothetical protein